MAQAQETFAQARKRRFWFDPRFAIGIAMVIVSVVGVSILVATADRTEAVYSAGSALSVGDRVHPDDLVLTRVRLGGVGERYLAPGDLPGNGFVITRSVAAGELLPASAVGDASGLTVSSMVIDTRARLAQAIDSGAVVDVWAAREGEDGVFGPPGVLVPSAVVVRVLESDGLMSSDAAASVEILVPKERIARVLEALANSDSLSLVPLHQPVGE